MARAKTIHLPGRRDSTRTLCGKPAARLEVLPSDHCVDDATCGLCHRVDTRLMLASHRRDVGEGALFRVVQALNLSADDAALMVEHDAGWRRIATALAAMAAWEDEVDQLLKPRIVDWLQRHATAPRRSA